MKTEIIDQEKLSKRDMAYEVINLIPDYASINLGIGMPTMVAEHLPKEKHVMIHSENGVLGVEGRPLESKVSATLINAGKETVSIKDGASFFDSAMSFGMIRGGHLDFAILGGMEVDINGSLANWMIPGKKVTGMGGAMDLVNGAKTVVVMMSHYSKHGDSKLVKKCSLPLTGKAVTDYIVSDQGVFKIENDRFKIIKCTRNFYDKERDNELYL